MRQLKRLQVISIAATLGLIWVRDVYAEGHPSLASYSADTDRIFWFLHVTDIHIGSGDVADDNLELLVTDGYEVFQPWFYLATGDLVEDGRSGEWSRYRRIITDAGLGADQWWDIPGNHDNNLDGDDFEPGYLDYYLEESISGAVDGEVHHNWILDTSFGRYQVVGIYTDGDADRRIFPEELEFARVSFEAEPDARLTFVGGHHPLYGEEACNEADADAFESLMADHGVSLYLFGHVHSASDLLWPHEFTDHGYLSWGSPTAGKPEFVISPAGFSVFAIDSDSMSGRVLHFRSPLIGRDQLPLPVVVVTAPADWSLGRGNPYAYTVSQASADNPVRALVFNEGDPDQVRFRLDDGDWQPMANVDGPLWAGQFDGAILDVDRDIELEVEARAGSRNDSHTITIRAAHQAACQDGEDNDGDGAVDFPTDPGCTGGFDTDESEPYGVPPYEPVEPDGDADADGADDGGADSGSDGDADLDADADMDLDADSDADEMPVDSESPDAGQEDADPSDGGAVEPDADGRREHVNEGCDCSLASHRWSSSRQLLIKLVLAVID